MQYSYLQGRNNNIAALLLIIVLLIFAPFYIFYLNFNFIIGIIITIIASIFVLKDLQWGIPLLVIISLIPWSSEVLGNPSNLVIGLMVGSYLLNPTQLSFHKLNKYKKLCTLILIFILLDFIATARQVVYWTDEGLVYIFVQYFLKSNFYPILFLIILCRRNLSEKVMSYSLYIYILLVFILSCIILGQIIFLDYYSSAYLFDTISHKLLIYHGKNQWGVIVCFAIVISLWIFNNNNKNFMRILMLSSLVIFTATVFFTYSRQSYLLLFIIFIYGFFSSRTKLKHKIWTIASIGLVIMNLYFTTPHLLKETFSDTFGIETLSELRKSNIIFDRSIQIRSLMYNKQIDYFAENPHFLLIGGGKSHSRLYFKKYRGMYAGEKSMHSAILTIFDNYGLIGFYILFSIHYLIIKSANKNTIKRELLILYSIVYIFSYFFQGFHIFIYSIMPLMFWIIAAFTLHEFSTKVNNLSISN